MGWIGCFYDIAHQASEQLLVISNNSKQSSFSSKYIDLPRKLPLSLDFSHPQVVTTPQGNNLITITCLGLKLRLSSI